MNKHQISKQTQTTIKPQILKDNLIFKQTEITNEPQILKDAQISNES
jgi:hypothetical protein